MVCQRIKMLLRLLISALFIFSASIKLLDNESFIEVLQNYDLLNAQLNAIASLYIPLVEILAALLLLIPQTMKAAAYSLISLLVIFSGALSILVISGKDSDCGCFGQFAMSADHALIRNAILVLLLILSVQEKTVKFKVTSSEEECR